MPTTLHLEVPDNNLQSVASRTAIWREPLLLQPGTGKPYRQTILLNKSVFFYCFRLYDPTRKIFRTEKFKLKTSEGGLDGFQRDASFRRPNCFGEDFWLAMASEENGRNISFPKLPSLCFEITITLPQRVNICYFLIHGSAGRLFSLYFGGHYHTHIWSHYLSPLRPL